MLTLITFRLKQGPEATTHMEADYFNQLIGSVFLFRETKTPDSSGPQRQVVNGPVEKSGNQQ